MRGRSPRSPRSTTSRPRRWSAARLPRSARQHARAAGRSRPRRVAPRTDRARRRARRKARAGSRLPPRLRPRASRYRAPDDLGHFQPEAFVDPRGEPGPILGGDVVEIEHFLLAPVAHHVEAWEYVRVGEIADPVQRLQIAFEIDHRRRAAGKLHVDEDGIDRPILELLHAGLQPVSYTH